MAKKLIFTCPKCGGHSVEEIVNCSEASYLITNIEDDGSAEFAYPSLDEDAMTDRYQCADCGHVIPDVNDIEGLAEYIKKNQ